MSAANYELKNQAGMFKMQVTLCHPSHLRFSSSETLVKEDRYGRQVGAWGALKSKPRVGSRGYNCVTPPTYASLRSAGRGSEGTFEHCVSSIIIPPLRGLSNRLKGLPAFHPTKRNDVVRLSRLPLY